MLNNSKPNQPIILLETDIVGIDGQPVRIPTTVVFQLSPYPTVVIELEHIPPEVPRKEDFTVSMSNGAQLNAICPSPAYIIGKGSLTPLRRMTTTDSLVLQRPENSYVTMFYA